MTEVTHAGTRPAETPFMLTLGIVAGIALAAAVLFCTPETIDNPRIDWTIQARKRR